MKTELENQKHSPEAVIFGGKTAHNTYEIPGTELFLTELN